MAKKKPKPKCYSITLEIGGNTYQSEGETMHQALMSLSKPEKIMNKAILTVEHGDYKGQQMFMPTRLRRLFYSPTMQAIQAKQLLATLKPV